MCVCVCVCVQTAVAGMYGSVCERQRLSAVCDRLSHTCFPYEFNQSAGLLLLLLHPDSSDWCFSGRQQLAFLFPGVQNTGIHSLKGHFFFLPERFNGTHLVCRTVFLDILARCFPDLDCKEQPPPRPSSDRLLLIEHR